MRWNQKRIVFNIVVFNLLLFYVIGFSIGIGTAQSALMISFVLSVLLIILRTKRSERVEHIYVFFIGLLPIINYSKGGFFFYNILSFILILISVYYVYSRGISSVFKRRIYTHNILFFFGFILYVFSAIYMRKYDANLKVLELILTATLFTHIVRSLHHVKFLTKLLGMSAVSLVIFLTIKTSGTANRLMIDRRLYLENGVDIGGSNPINFGLPLIFCLLIMIISYNRAVRLRSSNIILGLVLVISLLLTTSRGSLLVLILGVLCYILATGRYKLAISIFSFGSISYVVFSLLAMYLPDFASSYDFLVTRTKELDDVNQISQGRLEQWIAMGEYLRNNLSQMVFGFGPGNQFYAHSIISSSGNLLFDSFYGKEFAYHALLLRLLAEVGILGLLIYVLILAHLFRLGLRAKKVNLNPARLVFLVGWFAIGLSVSSFDCFSGLFLGMGISNIQWTQ